MSATQYWDRNKLAHTSAINHDGWRFISQALPTDPVVTGAEDWLTLKQAADDRANWAYSGGDGDGRVHFPITVKRVAIAMRDWQVYVTDMVPTQSRSIRLGPLMVGD